MSVEWSKYNEENTPCLIDEELISHDLSPRGALKKIATTITTAATPCVWGIMATASPAMSATLSFNRVIPIQTIDEESCDNSVLQEELLPVSMYDNEDATLLYNKWVSIIKDFGNLESDWDGDDAVPVYKEAIKKSCNLLAQSMSEIFILSEVYPTPFGTICMEWKNDIGQRLNLEMGKTRMGFYIDSPREDEIFTFESAPINRKNRDILLQHLYRL